MLQLPYWLACLSKTLAILSLIIYLPQNKYSTKLTKGFLFLYINETILFFVSFYVAYLFGEGKFELAEVMKLVTNVYEVVICCGVVVWLVGWKKSLVTKNVEVMSIVVIIFTWMAVLIVGVLAVASQDPQNIQNLINLSSGLAWTLCILKLLLQFNHNNTQQTLGPNYLFIIFTISWVACEAFYDLTKSQNQLAKKISIGVFAFVVCLIGLMMYSQRRDTIRMIEMRIIGETSRGIVENQRQQQKRLDNPINDTLRESLIDNLKRSDRTHYTSSFVQSIDDL